MKKVLNVFVFGLNGRMGQEIQTILGATSKSNLKLVKQMKQADVIIDFSSPEGLSALVKEVKDLKCALVSGTTGSSKKQSDELRALSHSKAVLWSSNFSPGLWMFREALKAFKYADGFDFAMDEVHHTAKKDNPSGTALTLHKDLESITTSKITKPIGKRIGGVFGIHTVQAASPNEILRFEHMALNRRVFAQGALDAALWIVNQDAGLYSMDDFMKDKVGAKK